MRRPSTSASARTAASSVGCTAPRLAPTALDRHQDVRERHSHGGLWLVDRHLDGLHQRAPQCSGGDLLSQTLDQVQRRPGDQSHDVGGDVRVADRVFEEIAATRAPQVNVESHVNDETLTLCLLEVEHPVEAMSRDSLQDNAIRHRAASVAATTRSASTLEATSWTRTAQAPASPAITVVAAVAGSRCAGGRLSAPSGTPRRPRNVLREAPTSTGEPRDCTASRWASNDQLCSGSLAKPNPGSRISWSRPTP